MDRLNEIPYYTRIALLGIAMYVGIEIVTLVVNLILQPSEWAYPVVVGGIVGAIGAVIYFVRPWGLIVGVLGGLVGILFSMNGLGDNLASPDSFFDFAYRPVIGLAATIFVLGGSIAGLVQHFRRRTSTSGPVNVTRAVKGVLGLVAVLSLASALLTVASVHRVSSADKEGAVTLTAYGLRYDSDTLMASGNGTTRIVFKNDDLGYHTLTIAGLDVDVRAGPRSEELLELHAPKPGTYVFYCRISGHEDLMRGMLTVR